jgi:hypothetical protein
MAARIARAIGWSLLFGFATGAASYVAMALLTAWLGPVFYNFGFVEHAGRVLLFGIGGLVIIGSALLVSYLAFLRSRPARQSIATLALVAFAVQFVELGAIEMFAIREPNSLVWPISEQLMPFNIGLFAPVGIWEGRPDAAFLWFSAAAAVTVYAVLKRVRG